jgi:hypothetical protein
MPARDFPNCVVSLGFKTKQREKKLLECRSIKVQSVHYFHHTITPLLLISYFTTSPAGRRRSQALLLTEALRALW